MSELRGLDLRAQAVALLQMAAAADGLRPFAITHRHAYGSSTYLLWAADQPTEEQAASVLEADYEPDKGEELAVESNVELDELCGLAAGCRLDAIEASGFAEHARSAAAQRG